MNSRRLKFAAAGALAAGSATSNASVVVFDFPEINVAFYDAWHFVVYQMDFSAGTFSYDGAQNFTFGSAGGYLYFHSYETSTSAISVGGFNRMQVFGGSALISPNLGWFVGNTAYLGINDTPQGTFYIPLRRLAPDESIYCGWFGVETWVNQDSQLMLRFSRFAFNTVAGQSILAGQTTAVPEASTLGYAGGLFGLVVAAHLRRRKQKQAAASDKFLALAAGESVRD